MARPNAGASERSPPNRKTFRATYDRYRERFVRRVVGAEEALPIAKLTALLHADPHLTPQNVKLMEEIR